MKQKEHEKKKAGRRNFEILPLEKRRSKKEEGDQWERMISCSRRKLTNENG
jgi:hypothetical protein